MNLRRLPTLYPLAPVCIVRAAIATVLLAACAGESAPAQAPGPTAPAGAPRIAVTYIVTQPSRLTPVVVFPATPTPSTAPEPTPVPSPVPSPTSEPPTPAPSQCPAPGNPQPPARPESFSAAADDMAAYLNAGASIAAARQLLADWGLTYPAPDGSGQRGDVLSARLAPSDDAQIIALFYDPADPSTTARSGDLIVFACAGGTMQTLYRALADPVYRGRVSNLRMLTTEDVTGDGLNDASFSTGDCGASTCFDTITILSAAGGSLADVIPAFTSEPSPIFSFVPAASGTSQNLQARIGQYGSIGAGPQRATTQVWSFNGAVFTRTHTLVDPPVYRIHALHDADAAFQRQDYAAAAPLYQRVATDPGLKTWEGAVPLRNEDQVLGAFARVRLMQLAAVQGDAASAGSIHAALIAAAPEGSPGEMYAQLGEAFYATFTASNDYAQACDAAVRFAENNANTYILLGTQTFGYANYDYQPQDMCIGKG